MEVIGIYNYFFLYTKKKNQSMRGNEKKERIKDQRIKLPTSLVKQVVRSVNTTNVQTRRNPQSRVVRSVLSWISVCDLVSQCVS